MTKLLDANLIIRFLVEGDKKKADSVEKLLASGEELILTDVTVSEIIWILTSFYKLGREEITEKIGALLFLPNIKANKKLLLKALSFYCQFSIDWIDAYLAAIAIEKDLESIYSYDQDLDKVKGIIREEP